MARRQNGMLKDPSTLKRRAEEARRRQVKRSAKATSHLPAIMLAGLLLAVAIGGYALNVSPAMFGFGDAAQPAPSVSAASNVSALGLRGSL